MKIEKPRLITFDIFGTVLNWFDGLQTAVQDAGFSLDRDGFDRVIDRQALSEQKKFALYSEITAQSLLNELEMSLSEGRKIGERVGEWPLFPDSAQGLKRLMDIAPCVAMSNSDRMHGEQVQAQLGFRLSNWFCAEETKVYKPNPDFWHYVAEKTGAHFDRTWWHVSAYADYDLQVAKELGLTTVFVSRHHSRAAPADLVVKTLLELATKGAVL